MSLEAYANALRPTIMAVIGTPGMVILIGERWSAGLGTWARQNKARASRFIFRWRALKRCRLGARPSLGAEHFERAPKLNSSEHLS